jgi:hypothetical protein
MSKHTPGPWRHESHASDERGTGVIWSHAGEWTEACPNGRVVAEVRYYEGEHRAWRGATGEEFEANARLIAAAPELLDALNHAIAIIECAGLASSELPAVRDGIAKARAAIAKAGGQS